MFIYKKNKEYKRSDVKRMMIFVSVIFIIAWIILFPKISDSFKGSGVEKEEVFYEGNTVNPYMGFAPPAEGGPYQQPHSLVFANLTWRDLESEKGNYNFEEVEERIKLEYWKEQNVKLVFRIVLDYPKATEEKDIPDWLYEEINQDGTWYEDEYGKGFSPNYANKKLINYHEKLIQALGERYNDNPAVAFVELGSLGHYGEWHTLQQNDTYIPFPKLPVAEAYANHYIQSFDNKILLMRRPHQIAKDHNMGLYNDMFGNAQHTVQEFWKWVENGYQFWLTKERNPAMPDYWKTAPTGGELAPTEDWRDYFSNSNFSETIEQLELTHVSWLGPSSPVNYPLNGELQDNITTFQNKMGYHFRLENQAYPEKVKQGEDFELSMEIENTGVAPFYYQWPVEFSLSDKEGEIIYQQELAVDITTWLPGTHTVIDKVMLPSGIDVGNYTVNIAILDPEQNKPGIQFNMKGKRADGRYEIGDITIH